MKTIFTFPGQGSQTVGMCKDVIENFAVARSVFQEVDEALDQNLSKVILKGPAEDLTLTENTQPALMACSMAILRVIEQESGRKLSQLCDYVAGHSLGEFTALTAAGVFQIADCARLLKIRGKAMQNAVAPGKGGMVALLGLQFEQVQELIQQAKKEGVIAIANDNSNGQQVISGEIKAIEYALQIAAEKSYKAVKLNVSAPFHCPLMEPAAREVEQALEDLSLNLPTVPVIANVTAQIVKDIEQIKNLLVTQVTNMVRWRESIQSLSALGVTTQFEVGAGKVLAGLTKRIDANIVVSSIQNMDDIKNYLNNL